MSRPKKEEKRTKVLNIRLTEMEYELLKEEAKSQNQPLSKYARHILTTKKVEIHYDLNPEDDTQKALLREHHKIGINLNQIARHLNSGGAETEELRKEIRKAISDLWRYSCHSEGSEATRNLH